MENFVKKSKLSTGLTSSCGKKQLLRVVIFAKQPVAGQVKTRLTPPLSSQQAAVFYAFSQADTVHRLASIDTYQTILCYSGARDYFNGRYPNLELISQGEGDLGCRLQRMVAEQFMSGGKRVCVIGTDSPDLPVDWIADVFEQLRSTDVVVIPADDGGYVLLGTRLPCAELFVDIDWSSAQVLSQTRQRASAAGYSYKELYRWQDVDDIADLRNFAQRNSSGLINPSCRSARYARRCLRMCDHFAND